MTKSLQNTDDDDAPAAGGGTKNLVDTKASTMKASTKKAAGFLWVFVESISAGDEANFAPDQISRS